MNEEKTFLEKYPEFKGYIWKIDDGTIYTVVKTRALKEILYKHFVRKEKLLMLKHDFDDLKRKTSLSDKPVNIDKQGRVMMFNDYFKKTYIENQKVIDVIDKIFPTNDENNATNIILNSELKKKLKLDG